VENQLSTETVGEKGSEGPGSTFGYNHPNAKRNLRIAQRSTTPTSVLHRNNSFIINKKTFQKPFVSTQQNAAFAPPNGVLPQDLVCPVEAEPKKLESH
jgi:hypothetical protein